MLIDSNIIIYSARPEYAELRRFLADNAFSVSALSYLEVLGYHKLSAEDRLYLEEFFQEACIIPISQVVLDRAVALRQERRMTLGDAIVAATALVNDLTLLTRNVEDFRWISQLKLLNPFETEAG